MLRNWADIKRECFARREAGMGSDTASYVEGQAESLRERVRVAFVERLRAAASKLSVLAKDAHNDHFGYDYTSEASVKRAVRAVLAECGLAITDVNVTALPGVTPTCAVVEVRLCVEDGSGNCAYFAGIAGDQDKSGKAVMKAEAGAFKYALLQGFAIPTGDDPEANREADAMGAAAKAETKPRTRKALATKVEGTDGW